MRYLIMAVLLVAATASADTNPVWRYRKILVIGDSLIGEGSGLGLYIEETFEAAPSTLKIDSRIGARPSTFARNNQMAELVNEFKPDTVIIVLGMNTLRTPASCVRGPVRRLLDQVGDRECFWIGPPPLIEGAGKLLRSYPGFVTSRCHYFDTAKELKFPPKSVTGFHVKRWKSKRWAMKFFNWVYTQVPTSRTIS